MIIEEQDREFQESLERDKKRMKQKEIEEEQLKAEREKQEQERKAIICFFHGILIL